jgi:hypothetical protein
LSEDMVVAGRGGGGGDDEMEVDATREGGWCWVGLVLWRCVAER